MGPYKCPDCGVWWAGLEHRCRVPIPGTGTWIEPTTGPTVVRPYVGPTTTGGTSSAPWCGICAGWHIPGGGPCTATYTTTYDPSRDNTTLRTGWDS